MSIKCDKCGTSSVDKPVFRTRVLIDPLEFNLLFSPGELKRLQEITKEDERLLVPFYFDCCEECGGSLHGLLEQTIHMFLFPEGVEAAATGKKKKRKTKDKNK